MYTAKIDTLHLEHFKWLQPSVFWIGERQKGQGLELVANH